VASLSFKIMDRPAVDVPAGDAAQLGLQLAVFAREPAAARSRLLAEKIATAVALAERGERAFLHLTESQRRDLTLALDAMIDDRVGNLPEALLALRAACR
jgi:hypothetical protein